jgi:hypothetical protein
LHPVCSKTVIISNSLKEVHSHLNRNLMATFLPILVETCILNIILTSIISGNVTEGECHKKKKGESMFKY